MPVLEYDPDHARRELTEAGVTVEPGNTPHEHWRATHGGATAVAYDDKVVVQGRDPHALLAILRDAPREATVYFDGASRGNPGPAAIGWVLVGETGPIAEDGRTIGRATNNQAEYAALIAGLEAAREYGIETIRIKGDSELIVKQVRGEYDTNNPTLRERRVRVCELLETFADVDIRHVPRAINDRADELAAEALDG